MMHRGKVFLDTNLLIYTLDRHDRRKRLKARQVLAAVAKERLGVVSTPEIAQ